MAPRVWVPPKMTSSILPEPRSWRELVSPKTQRMASEILDLPEPLGPTTPVMPAPMVSLVRSGKDLKPWISSSFRRMVTSFLRYWGRLRSACCAACCSAAFLLRPTPPASRLPLQNTPTVNCLAWSGPVSPSTT